MHWPKFQSWLCIKNCSWGVTLISVHSRVTVKNKILSIYCNFCYLSLCSVQWYLYIFRNKSKTTQHPAEHKVWKVHSSTTYQTQVLPRHCTAVSKMLEKNLCNHLIYFRRCENSKGKTNIILGSNTEQGIIIAHRW